MKTKNQIPLNPPLLKGDFKIPPFVKGGLGGICLCLLFACSTLPHTVDIPIAVPCTPPPTVDRPRLTIGTLRTDSPPADVIRAYEETLEQLGGYAEYLEELLDGYRSKP